MLLISLVVALLAALQLGDFFRASDRICAGDRLASVRSHRRRCGVFALAIGCATERSCSRRGSSWRCSLLPPVACRVVQKPSPLLDQSLHGRHRETHISDRAGDPGAAGRAGAMGAGAAALAARRRRGGSDPLAWVTTVVGRACHPQSDRAGVSDSRDQAFADRSAVAARRDRNGWRARCAPRDGLGRMLYQGPDHGPPPGRRLARPGWGRTAGLSVERRTTMAEATFRHHHHRLRTGRLCHRDPRGAARLQDRDRRARLSRRHLPQLGLHPDQGAAALGRDLPLHAARQGLRARRPTTSASTPPPSSSARAAVSKRLNDGVGFLMKKNKVAVIWGEASIDAPGKVTVKASKSEAPKGALGPGTYQAKHIIIATGARPRVLPGLEPDKKLVWTYFEAMVPDKIPKSLLVVGSGAIGIEFASLLPHARRRGDGGRGAAANPAGRGCRDRRVRAQAVREAGHQDPDQAPR